MGRKKGGSGAKNGRDSNPKYLGQKISDGQFALSGSILVRQRGTKTHPGKNVGCGKDHTLFATETGNARYYERNGRKLVDIVPVQA